jgi:hypothetical protein
MITAVLVALGRGVEVTAHWMACIAAALLVRNGGLLLRKHAAKPAGVTA